MSRFEIEKTKVRQTILCADKLVVTVTSWANYDGMDISLHEGDHVAAALSLTTEQIRAMQTAISAHETFDGVDDE
jgi:hypothetical protein